MTLVEIYMVAGFLLSAYSIVANDAIQTLGTFLASNKERPWWVLWLFACGVLTAVMVYGWIANDGDVAYGRLSKFPLPQEGLTWIYVVPPLVILLLTRYGIPVSTTFLVLAVFAPQNISGMFTKSLLGYAVAFVVAIVVYRFIIRRTTEYFNRTQEQPISAYWVVAQWASTAFLWSQWLVQDLANIYAFLPRQLSISALIGSLSVLLLLHAIIFYQFGGKIQQIVTRKTGTADIRAATIIDFLYGLILLFFKELSSLPMSTTWVFLGLLAGRQFAISLHLYEPPLTETSRLVLSDAVKAAAGLAVSVLLALGLPWVATLRIG